MTVAESECRPRLARAVDDPPGETGSQGKRHGSLLVHALQDLKAVALHRKAERNT